MDETGNRVPLPPPCRWTPEKLQRAAEGLRHLLYDYELQTDEEIAAFLRSEGLDPEIIAEDGRAINRQLAYAATIIAAEPTIYHLAVTIAILRHACEEALVVLERIGTDGTHCAQRGIRRALSLTESWSEEE